MSVSTDPNVPNVSNVSETPKTSHNDAAAILRLLDTSDKLGIVQLLAQDGKCIKVETILQRTNATIGVVNNLIREFSDLGLVEKFTLKKKHPNAPGRAGVAYFMPFPLHPIVSAVLSELEPFKRAVKLPEDNSVPNLVVDDDESAPTPAPAPTGPTEDKEESAPTPAPALTKAPTPAKNGKLSVAKIA